jgi:hypothetical protein
MVRAGRWPGQAGNWPVKRGRDSTPLSSLIPGCGFKGQKALAYSRHLSILHPMTDDLPKFVCPQCGGVILNRGYPKCEHCRADLPTGLLFSKAEMGKNWATFIAGQQRDADQRWKDAMNQMGADHQIPPPAP